MKLSACATHAGTEPSLIAARGRSIACDRGQAKISTKDVTLAVVQHICGRAGVFVKRLRVLARVDKDAHGGVK